MSYNRFPWTVIVGLTLGLMLSSGRLFASQEQVLWSFGGPGDGVTPSNYGSLIDFGGKLYGTTEFGGANGVPDRFGGVAFQLTPPAEGEKTWGESVVWSFAGVGDGSGPLGGLIVAGGKLYGTTFLGGSTGGGTAFQLTPPASGQTNWSESVLSSISNPTAGLVQAGGKLYGVTGEGEVVQLTRATNGWSAIAVYDFPAQNVGFPFISDVIAGLINVGGKLYGVADATTNALDGIAYQLTPPAPGQAKWSETQLWSFNGSPFGDGAFPVADLLEMGGKFYGTTPFGGSVTTCATSYEGGCGTVFQLTPPAPGQTAWTEKVLWSFGGPGDGANPFAPLIEAGGKLYGTTAGGGANTANNCVYTYTSGCGTVFQLTPPAPGQSAWTEAVLWSFGGLGDGANPAAGLLNFGGNLYGTTANGGYSDAGTVFRLTP